MGVSLEQSYRDSSILPPSAASGQLETFRAALIGVISGDDGAAES